MKSAGKYKIDNTEWISSLTLIGFKIILSDNKKWVDLSFYVRFFVWTFNMSKESLRKIFQCLNSNKRPLPIAWQVKLRAIFFFKVRVSLESWPPASQWREIGFWNPVPKGAIHSTKISGIFRSKTQWIGSVQPEKFRKNGSTFWGGPIFPVGPVGILVEWIAPQYSGLNRHVHAGFISVIKDH